MPRPLAVTLFTGLVLSASLQAGTIVVTTTADSGAGSLRAALEAANSGACPSPCEVVFNITGSPEPGGVFTIAPSTGLPLLSSGTAIIDGDTQTVFSGDTNPFGPEIVISGANVCLTDNSCWGLAASNGSAFRNLILSGFVTASPFTPGQGRGIWLVSTHSISAQVAGNYLGTDPTGKFPAPNDKGIDLRASGNTIRGNLISGNNYEGIFGQRMLTGSLDANVIVGNTIGANRDGTGPLPNGVGIRFIGSIQPTSNAIGTLAPGEGNLIAWNDSYGVFLAAGAGCGNTIRGNSIHSNGSLGIADTSAGFPPVSARGPCTAVRFPPRLESLAYDHSTNKTTVTGSHDSANASFTFDWYVSSEPDPSGFGEGEAYVTSRDVVTDGQGKWSVQLTGDLRDTNLVATTGQSSFSNVTGSSADLILEMMEEHTDPVPPETRLRYTLTVTNQGPDEATHVVVTDDLPVGVDAVGAAGAGWSCNVINVNVRCSLLQPLPAGQSRSLTIEADAETAPNATITNTAAVTFGQEEINPANNAASVSTFVRDWSTDLMVEHRDAPRNADGSGLVRHTLRVGNFGLDAEPAVHLKISMTGGVVESTGGVPCTGTNPVHCDLGPIGSGEHGDVEISVRPNAGAKVVKSSAEVTGLRKDAAEANNTSTAETQLRGKSRRRVVRH